MAHGPYGRNCHRRAFLAAIAVTPVTLLGTGCSSLLATCSKCDGKGRLDGDCGLCEGRGTWGGGQCPTCEGSGKRNFHCYSCRSSGKRPGMAGVLAWIFQVLIILGIPGFIALGIYLCCVRRLNVFKSRQLRKPMTKVLGVFAFLTAAALCTTELLMGLLFFVGGMGPEGPSNDPIQDTMVRLTFGTAGMIIAGAFLLVGGVIVLSGKTERRSEPGER
jgi:hypothetical protein